MKRITSILLIAGIIVLINLISDQFFFRWDWTEGKQYTLSSATKDVLKELDQPLTVKAYFSGELPPDFEKVKGDFQDMLIEYRNLSKGMVDYQFINPAESPETEQEALQSGIRPVLINVREKDQSTQRKAFMGAILSLGDQEEVLAFIGPQSPMEYDLTRSIKKIAVVDKPSIGFITGHGEPPLNELGQVVQALSVIFTVETIDLSSEGEVPPRFNTLVWIRPQDSIPTLEFQVLDAFLNRGGNLLLAMNAVAGDFNTARGTKVETNLYDWLALRSLVVEPNFVIDASCGSVTVQQRQGFFTINTPVQFPFLPVVKAFPEHPVTEGLEQVLFEFVSPLRYQGDTTGQFTVLVTSSGKSGIQTAPTYFNVADKQWNDTDFPQSNIPLAGVLEGQSQEGNPFKLLVIADGDFPIGGNQGRGINPDNVNLLANGIEWLADQSGLAALRTKGVTSRPIEDLEEGRRNFIKYLNFFLPLALVVIVGIFRSQRNRNIRLKRMQESYR